MNNKSSSNHESKRHNYDSHLERRPKKCDKEEQPLFYQSILKKNIQEVNRKNVKSTKVSTRFVDTRRVHFSLVERNDSDQQSSSSEAEVTRRLSWTNHKGIVGTYTGQVNEYMQPHGFGAFICEDGKAKTCIWKDGMPVQGWKPKKKNRSQKSHDHQASSIPLSTSINQTLSTSTTANGTYLHHLDIGDVATPQDMLQEEPKASDIDSLQIHDFAFILRSDGYSWTYAIIADRQDDGILFVVDIERSNKMLMRKHWSTCIRVVSSKRKYNAALQPSPSDVSKLNVELPGLLDGIPPPPLCVVGIEQKCATAPFASIEFDTSIETDSLNSLFE